MVVKGLLFAGAKRDVVLNHGVTALHHACDTRSYEVAMLLLSYVDTARGKPPKVSMARSFYSSRFSCSHFSCALDPL